MNPITVTVNGEPRQIAANEPLAELVGRLTDARSGVAVAVDGEVVPRTAWPEHVLEDGATIEILTAVQGG